MLTITKERAQRGLSMSALARIAGMHVSSISAIENGRLNPYPGQVRKIADALGWEGDPSELFEEVGDHDVAAV